MTKLSITRETASCIRNGHGWIPTADGPVYAHRARTCWWQVGSCELRGDLGSGYDVVGMSDDCMLIAEPTRLYPTREKAARAAKRFWQNVTPCERPSLLGVSARSVFAQLVRKLYDKAAACEAMLLVDEIVG